MFDTIRYDTTAKSPFSIWKYKIVNIVIYGETSKYLHSESENSVPTLFVQSSVQKKKTSAT